MMILGKVLNVDWDGAWRKIEGTHEREEKKRKRGGGEKYK